MKRLCFLTYSQLPALAADEQPLIADAKKSDIEIIPVIWNKLSDAENYDALIFRSPWDYHNRFAEFTIWLNALEKAKVKTFNPIDVIKYNINKNYLFDLEKKGIRICPSILVKNKNEMQLKEIMKIKRWDTVVVKPTVSATAFNTFKIHINEADSKDAVLQNLLNTKELLIQPYLHEIEAEEISLIYFHKKFSHAILKRPKQGDFRVQKEYGGTVENYNAPADEINFGRNVLDKTDNTLLYARVDFVKSVNSFYLMELEIFEPSLYLLNETARKNFMNALCEI